MSKARHSHGPARAGMSHDKGHYGGKPPMHPHHGHPMHHKRARGGGIGDTPDEKPEVYEGGASGTAREADRKKRGGAAMKKGPMHVDGHASRHQRLDRRGRKRGGSVGADSHPMTEAANLTRAEGQNDNVRLDREDD